MGGVRGRWQGERMLCRSGQEIMAAAVSAVLRDALGISDVVWQTQASPEEAECLEMVQ